MEFCPTCGTMLQIEPARGGRKMRFYCPTCPYVCPTDRKIVKKLLLVKKKVEPIFSADDGIGMYKVEKKPISSGNDGVDKVEEEKPISRADKVEEEKPISRGDNGMDKVEEEEPKNLGKARKVEASCSKCNHGEAYFKQLQILSPGEPMTKIYKCCNENCKFGWLVDEDD